MRTSTAPGTSQPANERSRRTKLVRPAAQQWPFSIGDGINSKLLMAGRFCRFGFGVGILLRLLSRRPLADVDRGLHLLGPLL